MTFERTDFANEGDEAGVFIDGLSSALLTWTAMQDHTPTVGEAARVFNTTIAVIEEAVGDAMWIYIDQGNPDPAQRTLELDGA